MIRGVSGVLARDFTHGQVQGLLGLELGYKSESCDQRVQSCAGKAFHTQTSAGIIRVGVRVQKQIGVMRPGVKPHEQARHQYNRANNRAHTFTTAIKRSTVRTH